MAGENELRELIRDAQALLDRLDRYPESPAAAYVASAIDALNRLLEAKVLPRDPRD